MERKIEDIILDEINEVLQHFLMRAELETVTGENTVTYHYNTPVELEQYCDSKDIIERAIDSVKMNIEDSCKKVADRFELTGVEIDSNYYPNGAEIKIDITGNIKE
jgi:hypothetical protein